MSRHLELLIIGTDFSGNIAGVRMFMELHGYMMLKIF